MTINANTRIAAILKQDQRALEAIVSIGPAFRKLRNPLLRKVMAGRTSLQAASRLAGCPVEDFFRKLELLGFKIDRVAQEVKEEKNPVPAFIISLTKECLVELDVRSIIASGGDPLTPIMQKARTLQPMQTLKIINTFEPTPLILLLEKKGFEVYVDKISSDLVETYFYKTPKFETSREKLVEPASGDWEQVNERFSDKLQEVDVRHLEMPQPMHTILGALDHLPNGVALYVYHKCIPVYLLSELAERGFEYRIKEVKDGEVYLLIFEN